MSRTFLSTAIAGACVLLIAGCSSTGNPAAPAFSPAKGQHPATWVEKDHWTEYLKNPDQCRTCHGSTKDRSLAGGISGVSCFGCHHPEGPAHPDGFADPAQHGRLHAQAVANLADPFAMAGMASCQTCHGADYNTPVGFTKGCFTCHTQKAPHPDRSHWVLTGPGQPNHDRTDQSNAPVCFKCHANGANSTLKPTHPPTGTEPGCFNNTLCHGGGTNF